MNKSELQAKLSTLEKQVANAPANARPLMQSAIEKIKGQIQELEGSEAKPSAPEKTTTARGKGRPKGTTKPKKEVEKKGRGRPKKEVTPEVKPITETQINKVAKDIREEGEPMIRARKRAKKALVEIKDVAKDTAKMESKGKLTKAKILAEIKKLNKVFANLGIDIQVDSADDLFRDATRTALPKGWRTSKNGKEYYENRPNRSDSLQNTPVYSKLKLAEGGMMEKTRVGTYEGKDAVKGEVIGTFVADNGTNIELVSSRNSDSPTGRMFYVAINGRGLYAREYREDAYELYRDEIEKYKMKFAKGGELRYQLAGKNFSDQIENGRKFKELINMAYESQTPEHEYPENFIKEIAFTGNIVKSHGGYYVKDYMYKGTMTEFDFLSNEYFLEALKYLNRPTIKNFKYAEGGFMSGGVSDYELNNWFDSLPESSQLLYTDADTYEEAEEIWGDMDYDSKLELYLSVGYSDGDDEEYEEEYAKGGMVDLFEDYENIPPKIARILEKYEDAFEDGDYKELEMALSEVEANGYTFEYGLSGDAYGLRPKNVPLNKLKGYAKGGEITYKMPEEKIYT